MDSGAIVASCNDLAARATAARAALLSLCEALSALVPVAPASGAPATEPRRTVGAVVRDGTLRHYDEDDLLIVVAEDPAACQRFLDNPRRDLSLADAYPEDEFVRWATREECERHGIPYVARPLPGAPLAAPAPSPAPTPAAGLPVDESAFDEAKDREAARRAWYDAPGAAIGTVEREHFVMGWLARARVAAKESRSGDDRPASGQSATKPVDRVALAKVLREAENGELWCNSKPWGELGVDAKGVYLKMADAAIAHLKASGGAS